MVVSELTFVFGSITLVLIVMLMIALTRHSQGVPQLTIAAGAASTLFFLGFPQSPFFFIALGLSVVTVLVGVFLLRQAVERHPSEEVLSESGIWRLRNGH